MITVVLTLNFRIRRAEFFRPNRNYNRSALYNSPVRAAAAGRDRLARRARTLLRTRAQPLPYADGSG